jgi:hypothetical protein
VISYLATSKSKNVVALLKARYVINKSSTSSGSRQKKKCAKEGETKFGT